MRARRFYAVCSSGTEVQVARPGDYVLMSQQFTMLVINLAQARLNFGNAAIDQLDRES